jgi:hypothetical protein
MFDLVLPEQQVHRIDIIFNGEEINDLLIEIQLNNQ